MKKSLFMAFAKYPDYTFIVKVSKGDEESLKLIKEFPNINMFNWLPQTDLLGHPNLKLFITHAGGNSVIESAIRGVPIIAIPLFYDQFRNAYASEYRKFAYVLEKDKINIESVTQALNETLNNKKLVDSPPPNLTLAHL